MLPVLGPVLVTRPQGGVEHLGGDHGLPQAGRELGGGAVPGLQLRALGPGDLETAARHLLHRLAVLDLRFGLTGNGTHSLRQIGHLLRISKERVRQIQNRALEKLRASAERVGWEPTLLLE